jgi:hypothetical protein
MTAIPIISVINDKTSYLAIRQLRDSLPGRRRCGFETMAYGRTVKDITSVVEILVSNPFPDRCCKRLLFIVYSRKNTLLTG